MISVLRQQDYTNPHLPSLTEYTFPATITEDRMDAFVALRKVLKVARESPRIDFSKEGCFVMFPRKNISELWPAAFQLKNILFLMQWIRLGKPIWFLEPKGADIRVIEIPGIERNPGYPNSDWEQYAAFVFHMIGGTWARWIALIV